MERDQVAGLAAELNAQIRLIERVQERLLSHIALGLEWLGLEWRSRPVQCVFHA